MHGLTAHWYRLTIVSVLLAPLALIYCALAGARRGLYRVGFLPRQQIGKPVIVVGNITVGGTGKTPVVIWLARLLREAGFRPGIVSRGYRGAGADWPQDVRADSDPALVGDEPVLAARRAECPVVADPDRVRGARHLVNAHGCDVVVSDDGLQHYRLARDIEIAVIDGARRFGNGLCLPAGPLREPHARLASVDLCVTLGAPQRGEIGVALRESGFHSSRGESAGAQHFRGTRVHAVAGIGNPARFFAHLRTLGVEVIEHPFPDHHSYVASDLAFGDDLPILMTEKDAVKCVRLAVPTFWYLVVEAQPDAGLGELVMARLKENR